MDFWTVLFLFFSGVFTHMFALRIFKIWSKSMLYRATFVRCLNALQMTDEMSQQLLKSVDSKNAEQVEIAFNYWRAMSLLHLQSAVNNECWRNIAVTDWKTAMKILEQAKGGQER